MQPLLCILGRRVEIFIRLNAVNERFETEKHATTSLVIQPKIGTVENGKVVLLYKDDSFIKRLKNYKEDQVIKTQILDTNDIIVDEYFEVKTHRSRTYKLNMKTQIVDPPSRRHPPYAPAGLKATVSILQLAFTRDYSEI